MSSSEGREAERRLLILAPLGRDAQMIADLLARNAMRSVVCRDCAALLEELELGAAGIIATEEALLGNEARLEAFLHRQPPWSDLPVMILTRTGADSPEAVRATTTLGNVTLLERPVRVAALTSAARSALRARERQYQGRAQLDALRASETRLSALINASSDAVYRMNADWSEMLGLHGSGFIADTQAGNRGWLGEYIHPDDQALFKKAIEQAVRSRSLFELEHRVRRLDGTLGWTLSRAVPLFGESGEIVEWFGAASDVTLRKQAEEALRESEEKYRTLFDSIDQGFCIIEVLFDEDGEAEDYRFLETNGAFSKQTGLVDVVGKRMRELAPAHEAHWFEIYGHIARTGVPARFEAEAAALGRFFDVYAFRTGRAGQNRVAVLFDDIASRKKFEEALKEADRHKDEFLAILAHELRNPLAPIRNGLNIARLSSKPDTTLGGTVDMMDRQLNHLVRLVDDLLDVGRITHGKIALRREPVRLSAVLASSIEGMQAVMDAQRHRLVVDEEAEGLVVSGDFERLAQIVSNLLSNAAKYTDAGGRITVRTSRDGRHAVVEVTDTGIGIAADDLSHVFDLFSQARRQEGRDGGLGIGLGLVRRLVEMHGGEVSASSKGPGRGATFTVRLPLISGENDAQDERPASPPAHDRAGERRVLVVDDNADAADSLATMLGMQGHEVSVARDGLQAIDAAARMHPEVVLLDLGMPRMDGIETARRLRALPGGDAMILVALTGWGQEQDRERTRAAGFDHHLVKPVDLAHLEAILARQPA